jgi:MerR family transcriptional regulator, light-induced transcriptional regulator
MSQDILVARLLEVLVSGDRPAARRIVQETVDHGVSPQTLLHDLFWPTQETIDKLYRSDQMTQVSYHLATRLLRTLVDQASARLDISPIKGRSVFAVCGTSPGEELAGQIATDLLEAAGCTVAFAGGGIPADEVMAQVHERRPDVLLMFAAAPGDLPVVREIINMIKQIGASNKTKIIVGGGVFNRAEGLAEEIGIDNWGETPSDVVDLISSGQLYRERTLQIDKPVVKVRRRAA